MNCIVLPQARRSIATIIDYLLIESSQAVALRFAEEVDEAFDYLTKWPNIGSPRRFRAARLVGIRSLSIRSFPNHRIYYRKIPSGIEIIDVVHAARDLPRALGDD